MGLPYVCFRFARAMSKICLGLPLRVRHWEIQNIPTTGPVVMVANHQCYWDPILVALYAKRVMHFMARDTLFANALFARCLRSVNAFPVKRGRADVASFKQALRLLKGGEVLVVFPEATRTTTGRIRDLQPGAVALARKGKAAIVPVAIEGGMEVWPRNTRLPRLGRIWLEYAPPLDASDLAGRSDQEVASLLTQRLRELHNGLRIRAGREPFDYAE